MAQVPHPHKYKISPEQLWEIDTSEGKVYFTLKPDDTSSKDQQITHFYPVFVSNKKGFNRLHYRNAPCADFRVLKNQHGWWLKIVQFDYGAKEPEFRLTPVESLPEGVEDEIELDIGSDEE